MKKGEDPQCLTCVDAHGLVHDFRDRSVLGPKSPIKFCSSEVGGRVSTQSAPRTGSCSVIKIMNVYHARAPSTV